MTIIGIHTQSNIGTCKSTQKNNSEHLTLTPHFLGHEQYRKGLPRWTTKFRVPDANLDATPDDGFSWRKYGQKDILGAKFPR
jgi:hypothetical protein